MQEMQQHVALRSSASWLQGLVAEVAEARGALLERASQRIPRHAACCHAARFVLPSWHAAELHLQKGAVPLSGGVKCWPQVAAPLPVSYGAGGL